MDLNLPPLETDPEGYALPHCTVGSIHPPINPDIVAEQLSVDQRIPDKMPEWLVQFAARTKPYKALEQFQNLHPPAFKGEADSMQAEEWLWQIEKILDVMDCTEGQRVAFTIFMFQRKAEHWWEMVKSGAKSAGEELLELPS